MQNIKAMRNAFADKDLKRDILDILYKSYGLDPYEETESDNQRRKQPIIISRPVQVPAKVQNVTQVPEKQITSSPEAPNSNQPKVQVIATQTPKVVAVAFMAVRVKFSEGGLVHVAQEFQLSHEGILFILRDLWAIGCCLSPGRLSHF